LKNWRRVLFSLKPVEKDVRGDDGFTPPQMAVAMICYYLLQKSTPIIQSKLAMINRGWNTLIKRWMEISM